jgi:hypothetical protein
MRVVMLGVQEILVIDRDTKAPRQWVRTEDRLVEVDAAVGATLRALDARLYAEHGTLIVETAATHRI